MLSKASVSLLSAVVFFALCAPSFAASSSAQEQAEFLAGLPVSGGPEPGGSVLLLETMHSA